jgi:hypothetical protein
MNIDEQEKAETERARIKAIDAELERIRESFQQNQRRWPFELMPKENA